MKHCPVCNSTFTDDSLRFCLQDGAALVPSGVSTATGSTGDPGSAQTLQSRSMPTLILPSGSDHPSEPTLVLPGNAAERSDPTLILPSGAPTIKQEQFATQPMYVKKPRNLALVVVLTMLATLIVAAFAGGGLWLYLREPARSGTGTDDPNLNGDERPANTHTSPSPTASKSPNAKPLPSASPTPNDAQDTAVREQVNAVLNGWVAASHARDAAANISFYADTLNPYYNNANFPASKVRDERARVYAMYQTLDIELSNIQITPDPSGDTAIATFDKTWTFENANASKYSSGSVRSQMWLAKSGNRWLITGEKDLKVYYLKR